MRGECLDVVKSRNDSRNCACAPLLLTPTLAQLLHAAAEKRLSRPQRITGPVQGGNHPASGSIDSQQKTSEETHRRQSGLLIIIIIPELPLRCPFFLSFFLLPHQPHIASMATNNKEEKPGEKSSWKDFIYNPRTGEFIGRTAKSWGKKTQIFGNR